MKQTLQIIAISALCLFGVVGCTSCRCKMFKEKYPNAGAFTFIFSFGK